MIGINADDGCMISHRRDVSAHVYCIGMTRRCMVRCVRICVAKLAKQTDYEKS